MYETQNDAVAVCTEGPVLVVNLHKDKWLNQPDECAKLVGSKVQLQEKQIGNDNDGNSSQTRSLPSDRVLTPTNPPPEYSHPPPQEVLSEVGSDTALMRTLKVIQEELRAIRRAAEQTIESTGRTAYLSKIEEETRDLTAFVCSEIQDNIVDEEVPDDT